MATWLAENLAFQGYSVKRLRLVESFGNSHLMTPSQDPVEGVQTDTLHWNRGARQVVSASKAAVGAEVYALV